jgi:hypothetical protein
MRPRTSHPNISPPDLLHVPTCLLAVRAWRIRHCLLYGFQLLLAGHRKPCLALWHDIRASSNKGMRLWLTYRVHATLSTRGCERPCIPAVPSSAWAISPQPHPGARVVWPGMVVCRTTALVSDSQSVRASRLRNPRAPITLQTTSPATYVGTKQRPTPEIRGSP